MQQYNVPSCDWSYRNDDIHLPKIPSSKDTTTDPVIDLSNIAFSVATIGDSGVGNTMEQVLPTGVQDLVTT